MTILSLAAIFFFVTNPIGISPSIFMLVKNYPFDRQRRIILREGLIALLIAIFFLFFGEYFLGLLNVQDYSLTLTGGIVLFLTSLQMLFPKSESAESALPIQEPFIVPIATPLLAGPGLMALIMVYSRLEENDLKIFLSILLAWVGVLAVLAAAPYLQRIFGKRGLDALQQVMGLILGLIAMQMIVQGGINFVKTLT